MCHVLVIEDEWLLAEYIADIARDAGATSVDMADSQREAIEAAARRMPAIILSDVKLIEGTGPRAVEAIQAAYGPVPTIFITGTPEECEPCNPPHVVLDKPVNEKLVSEVFRRLAPV